MPKQNIVQQCQLSLDQTNKQIIKEHQRTNEYYKATKYVQMEFAVVKGMLRKNTQMKRALHFGKDLRRPQSFKTDIHNCQ